MEALLRDKLSKVLFHGTLMDRADNIIKNGVDFSLLKPRADFGKGFYLTDSYALAKNTAIVRYNQEKMSNKTSYAPVVMKFNILRNDFDGEIHIKEFYGESIEWKKFVCTNRWNKNVLKLHPDYDNNIDMKYDIVIGLTADGKMGNINKLIKEDNYDLSNRFLRNINPIISEFTSYSNNKKIFRTTKSYQISFHNENFVKNCIKYKTYDIIMLDKEDKHYE